MGERATIDQDYLHGAADAIRRKNGTSNEYTPTQFEAAIDAIPTGGITPTGTINITENGSVDVTQYATANVNVPGGGGGATIIGGSNTPSSAVGSDGNLYLEYVPGDILPSGYTELEYVQFNGTQYFDTGIACNTQNLRVVADSAITGITTEAIWGGKWAENGYFLMIFNGRFRWHSGGVVVDAVTVEANVWYNIETDKTGIKINGTYYALSNPGTDSGENLMIGAVANNQGARAYMRLGHVRVYSGNTLLADYVPALDGSDVACMYDLVGQTAKYSALNPFTAGPTYQEGEIKKAYVKVNSAWQPLIGSNISDVGGVTV